MLVGEGERFDLEEIILAEQAVEVKAEGVRGQLRVKAGGEPGERVRRIDLDVELLIELVIDGLEDLASTIEQAADGPGSWRFWLWRGTVSRSM